MARQTRAQRRARREAQAQSQGGGGGVTQRARQRQAQVRPGAQPTKSQTGAPAPRAQRSFVGESWAELKKVEWPGQAQVIQATVVVLIACIVVGAYLYFDDLIWKPVVQWLIGQ